MAGTIGGLGYSVRNDINGIPMGGWTLTVYEGGTSTPASVFQDYALGIAHSNPIVADSRGMMPMFWVADGTYRVRGLDPDGNELFDDDLVVALGPSSGTGGGAASVDANALFQTGDFLWRGVAGTKTGWVRANARTIGSAASGGTERANADAEDLFLHLWNNYTDALCPVTGGRGGSAAADWAANKVIATPDLRGRAPFGLDDMGNSAASRIAAGTPTAVSASGAETVTVAQANLPNVNFTVTIGAGQGAHTHGIEGATAAAAGSERSIVGTGAGVASGSATLPAMTGTAASGGSGTALNKMPPYYLGSWHIKL